MVTADPQQTKEFFQKRWLEARVVSDEKASLYKAFEIERGATKEMFGFKSIVSGVKATLKGHTVGMPQGDPWRLGGFFVVNSELDVLWSYPAKHAGDHADLDVVAGVMSDWN